MANELKVYEFEDMQVRIVKDKNGEPWFVAKDVCLILGIVNNRQAVGRLDKDERDAVYQTDAMGRTQSYSVINEPGLYKLILRSDKPNAKDFQRWVTHEVLPSIRKTGGYIMGEEKMDEDQLVLAAMLCSFHG